MQQIGQISIPRNTVIREIRAAIASGQYRPGEIIPSERALAERFSVARKTARAVLIELEKEGLLVCHPGSSRRVAQRRGSSRALMGRTVAFFSELFRLPPQSSPGVGTDAQIDMAARATIEQAGYHVLIVSRSALEHHSAGEIAADAPAAIAISSYVAEAKESQVLVQVSKTAGIPLVVYGTAGRFGNFDRVIADHEDGAYQLTKLLLAEGRRRILPFWGTPNELSWLDLRLRGYQRAMTEAGLAPLPAVRTHGLDGLEGTAEGFHAAVHSMAGYLVNALAGAEPVDAIMTVTDNDAIRTSAAVALFGKEPNKDVLVVGYDNKWSHLKEREFCPYLPFATVDKNNVEVGRALGQLLLDRLGGKLPAEPQLRVVAGHIVKIPSNA